MGCKTWKRFLIPLLILINLLASVKTQNENPYYFCMKNGNYASNSTYGANLKTLLSSLSSNTNNSFYSGSVGQNLDRVNAVVLCRADQSLDRCRTCVQTASVGLPQQCPNQKQAIIWYELCMLRYSNEPIYGIQASDPGYNFVSNGSTGDVSSVDEFRAAQTRLLDVLRAHAANGGSELKVGVGSTSSSDSGTLYGLLQCTPDMSVEECDNCLVRCAQGVRSCCDSAAGVRVLMPSCNLRIENSLFYNETRLRELHVDLSPLPSQPPGTNNDNRNSQKKNDNTTNVVIIIVATISVCGFLIFAASVVIFLRKRMKRRPHEIQETAEEGSMVESLQYDYGKIRAATNDFADANKLGQGGFGAVYRGKLLNGEDIAVKRLLKESRQGDIEFKNEVLLLAKLHHRNLVRLLGFSQEGTERVLIYEFVQNGSLDQFIFDPIKRSFLDWDKCYKIIRGIARGLMYMHEDSRLRIVHRDLKASNVLLDGDMNPKIADFGTARLFDQGETRGNTSKIIGTYGYMSPEYAMHGQFSAKSDVFSFGVLVLEILSGRRNNYFQNEERTVENLLTSTWKNWQEGTAVNVIDHTLLSNGAGRLPDILRCIHVGLLCVQENAANRPTMTSIVLMLSSSTATLHVPSKPAFYMASRYVSISAEYNNSNHVKSGVSQGSPQNDMSITELHPR